MVESTKDKFAWESQSCADFFEIMGKSSVNDSDYLKFHLAVSRVQGVIVVVPRIPSHFP